VGDIAERWEREAKIGHRGFQLAGFLSQTAKRRAAWDTAPLTPSAHFLLPSHSGARGKRPPFGGLGQRRVQSRTAALRGAARLPVSGEAADAGNSPNCRRAPLAIPRRFSSPC